MACDSHIPKVQTMFSPSAPHFSKIILGQIPGNTKLQIPKTFWVKYCESLSSQAFLKLPRGSTWEVGLTKSSDGNVWMDKGWKAFAQHCSLSRGNNLVFRYEGNCRFNVIIFNKTMVEIDYPFDPNHNVDTKDDISVEVWGKSPLPCSQPHKRMKTSAYGKSEEGKKRLKLSREQNVKKGTTTAAAGAASSSVPVTHSTYTQPFNTLNQPFPLKLDRKNYVLWKTMVSTVIRGHHLDGFINGSRPCPTEFITTPTATEGESGVDLTINPEYEHWIVSDQLLMGWLYSSMTEGIATEVMGCDTAAALWKSLENLYGAHSRSRIDDTQIVPAGSSADEFCIQQMPLNENSTSADPEPAEQNTEASTYATHSLHIGPTHHMITRISSSSQDMILKVQDGRTWSVKYYVRPDRVTSKTRIERGWKAFVEDNYLKVGDVCAFVLRKSIGIVLFEVVIFHKNGVANSPMLPIPAAYMRSSTTPSKPKITPCVKIEPSFTNNSNDKESMVSQDLIAKKEIVEPSDKFMKVKSEANTDDNQGSNNKRLSSSEAASKFISNNPYLQVNLRSSQVYGGRPYIPMAFGNLYFEKKAQTVTFWVGEKNWLVNLTVNKRSVGLEYRFSSGWAAFARGNCLQPSDVCIFELIQRNQLQMKVTIFRQNGLPL
ncbi:hypothetical protein F8388_019879 [Cannabis sativa]|uniref:TF-B3 domain-containing protein n=1 Tax=Cannabis sativa TaxID=3483 RepID=A0A7J6H4S1_CANSA|nr:hypothetical protein F8388_019879 [Cannabis sativa]